MKNRINQLIGKYLPEVIAFRHELHRHPELAGEEFATSALIREKLGNTDIKLLIPFLKTDVVGILCGKGDGPQVALRADIDALPLEEMTGVEYASEYPGKMHACGHDGHTAILLGTALVLNELRDCFKGSVRFVFQPGEEVVALGKQLVAAGALDNPVPQAVYALHGFAGHETGMISSRPGPIMAAAGFFKITVNGRGGHGSAPQNTIDPILIGSQVVVGMQAILARNIDPREAAVVTFCHFGAGTNSNIIPEKAVLEGTVRYLDHAVGAKIEELLRQYATGICATYGATCDIEFRLPYSVAINNAQCTETVRETAIELFGPDAYQEMPKPSMGAEDFCYFLEKAPGAFFNLGVGKDSPSIHNPKFNFNDDAIQHGILMMVNLALKTLKTKINPQD